MICTMGLKKGGIQGLGGNMPKWEYRIRKTDLKALHQSSFMELEQMRLSEYGEEGWELVSAVPSQNGEALILFLKRPVEEGRRGL